MALVDYFVILALIAIVPALQYTYFCSDQKMIGNNLLHLCSTGILFTTSNARGASVLHGVLK